jgi:predicted acylesterase/phospholipase RssA
MGFRGNTVSLVGWLILTITLGGCVTLPRTPFTQAEEASASPPGFGQVRYAAEDEGLAVMLGQSLKPNAKGEIDALAISGGGANGAYGAGLLYGWSKNGGRPEFQLVTGISAGALLAPFAFLGPAWDNELRRAYFGPGISNLMRPRPSLGLFTPGLFNKAPLEELVRSYVSDRLLRAIAAEHAKGRRLLVGSTNLDTEQLVVWDMGAIASKGGAEARDLFATVLVASASIPGVYPPSMIKVESAGHAFSEMHVDGQTESAFFAIPQSLILAKPTSLLPFHAHLFIIINGHVDSQFDVTPRSTIPILKRTIDARGKSAVRSVILSTAQFCQRTGCELSVSSLPAIAKDDSSDFDPAHLESLFAAGEAGSVNGSGWRPAAQLIAP